jgi:prepilin-type N-terminal cleavage/methylation domain-containing protein
MKGFTLVELLLALLITLILGMIGLQLFRENEHTFETQITASEVQQNARAVLFQINDEIRRAGQGVPVYASKFDLTPGEPIATLLDGSDATHLRIRENYSNVQADILTTPSTFVLNTAQSLLVSDASSFYNELGTTLPVGHYVYIWGLGANSCWSWVRALLQSISSGTNTISLIPQQIGQSCRIASDTVRLTSAATIALEQAASIYWSSGSIWRTTATDMTSQTNPNWSAGAEIGRDFDGLTFTYYDASDQIIQPTTLAARLAIVRIDTKIHAQSGFGLSMRGYPVNLRFQ